MRVFGAGKRNFERFVNIKGSVNNMEEKSRVFYADVYNNNNEFLTMELANNILRVYIKDDKDYNIYFNQICKSFGFGLTGIYLAIDMPTIVVNAPEIYTHQNCIVEKHRVEILLCNGHCEDRIIIFDLIKLTGKPSHNQGSLIKRFKLEGHAIFYGDIGRMAYRPWNPNEYDFGQGYLVANPAQCSIGNVQQEHEMLSNISMKLDTGSIKMILDSQGLRFPFRVAVCNSVNPQTSRVAGLVNELDEDDECTTLLVYKKRQTDTESALLDNCGFSEFHSHYGATRSFFEKIPYAFAMKKKIVFEIVNIEGEQETNFFNGNHTNSTYHEVFYGDIETMSRRSQGPNEYRFGAGFLIVKPTACDIDNVQVEYDFFENDIMRLGPYAPDAIAMTLYPEGRIIPFRIVVCNRRNSGPVEISNYVRNLNCDGECVTLVIFSELPFSTKSALLRDGFWNCSHSNNEDSSLLLVHAPNWFTGIIDSVTGNNEQEASKTIVTILI